MSLRKSVRNVSKQGNTIPATVISTAGVRATVRLLSNGAVYRTLKVVGGPTYVGQEVAVDMNSDTPVIVAPGLVPADGVVGGFRSKPSSRTSIKAPITGSILRYASGLLVAGYPFSVAGMNDCLDDCETGNLIMYPNGILEMDFTLPADVTLSGINADISIFWGTVTLSSGSKINDILFLKELSSAEDAIAIIGPSTGEARLKDVKGMGFNCGSGKAVGLQQSSGGSTVAESSCIFYGESRSGLGYGAEEL